MFTRTNETSLLLNLHWILLQYRPSGIAAELFLKIAIPEILLKHVSRQHLSFKRGHNKVPVLVGETTGHQCQLKTAQHLAAQFVQNVYIVQNAYIGCRVANFSFKTFFKSV